MKPQIYRLSLGVKSSMILALASCLLMAVVISVLAVLAAPRAPDQLVAMWLLLCVAWGGSIFFWRTLPACDAYLEVSETAISQHQPRKATVTLLWSEISQIKNNPLMQRLELCSRDGRAKINVEHQIEDFARLKQLIESKIAP